MNHHLVDAEAGRELTELRQRGVGSADHPTRAHLLGQRDVGLGQHLLLGLLHAQLGPELAAGAERHHGQQLGTGEPRGLSGELRRVFTSGS